MYLQSLEITTSDQVYGVIASSRLLPVVPRSNGRGIPFLSLGLESQPLLFNAMSYVQTFQHVNTGKLYNILRNTLKEWLVP